MQVNDFFPKSVIFTAAKQLFDMKRLLSLALTAILAAGLLTGIPSCKKTDEGSIENTKWNASDGNGWYNLTFHSYQHEVDLDVKFMSAPGYLIRGNYEVNGNRVLITYTNFVEFQMGARVPEFPLKAAAEVNKKTMDYVHQQGDIVLDVVFTRVK